MAPRAAWPIGTVGEQAIIDGTVALSDWTQLSDAAGVYYKSTTAYSGK